MATLPAAHNPKVVGSNPSPATKQIKGLANQADPFLAFVAFLMRKEQVNQKAKQSEITSWE